MVQYASILRFRLPRMHAHPPLRTSRFSAGLFPYPHTDPLFPPTAKFLQGTPLWCEYLPPWVLRKEFHTILAAYGVQYLCSERFRRGLGPAEDTNDPTGGE